MDNADRILIIVITICFMALFILHEYRISDIESIVSRCEQSLPRDKHCVLTAVPEGEE